jgi:hypothetical protein
MQRLRFLTIAFVGIATLSLTNAAYSAQSSLTKKSVIAPPQKTLNKKNDEIAKRGIIIVSGKNKPGSDRMLNPQPLPPKDKGLSEKGIIIVGGKNKAGSEQMLNPQPLPPKEKTLSAKNNLGSDRMLNPQPLPPKAINTLGSSDRMMNSPSQKALGGQKSY